ncbi:hypothetical protein [Vibrio sp. 1288]|uniref:hypothetical protein n=1 Tax=Vibrio sp. 1288 TaxID=3074550 RepID=UPI002966F6C5|nr:hypothetical protein [Vibrio sp. 1288]MDW3137696.1 hypothetical protein [Vibrio sp. 1288]
MLREKVNQSELLYVHDQPKKTYWAAKSTTGKQGCVWIGYKVKTNTISLFCSGDFLRLEPELANLAVEKREDSQSKRLRMKVPLEKFSAVLDILESI